MAKVKFVIVMLGVLLLSGLGAISVSAQDMKCGAGKCGASVKESAQKMKCGASIKAPKCLCGDECPNKENCAYKKDPSKACDCPKKGAMKCGAGKCGADMKESAKKMKCGSGKCGGK